LDALEAGERLHGLGRAATLSVQELHFTL
jgi:hypothetical protein